MTDRPKNTDHLKPDWNVGLRQNEPVGWALFLLGIAVLASYIIARGFQSGGEDETAAGPIILNLLHLWVGPVLIVIGAVLSDQVNRIIPFHGLRSGMYVTTLNLLRNLDPLKKEKFCQQYPNDPNANLPLWFGPKDATRRNAYLDAPDSRFRGRHVQYKNPETGELFCIICSQCSKVCPNDIITIESEMEEIEVDGKTKKKRKLTKFEVDLSKCFFCGLCQDVCPEPALRLTGGYEFGEYQRSKLVANLDNMVRELPREQFEEYKRQKEEEKRQKELAKQKKAEEAAKKAAEKAAEQKKDSHLGDKPAGDDGKSVAGGQS